MMGDAIDARSLTALSQFAILLFAVYNAIAERTGGLQSLSDGTQIAPIEEHTTAARGP